MEDQKVTDQGIHFSYKSGDSIQQVAQQIQNYIQYYPEHASLAVRFIEENSSGEENHSSKSIEMENILQNEQETVTPLREEGDDD
jgi:proline dehydrogenase